jgi:hypothetical protein
VAEAAAAKATETMNAMPGITATMPRHIVAMRETRSSLPGAGPPLQITAEWRSWPTAETPGRDAADIWSPAIARPF